MALLQSALMLFYLLIRKTPEYPIVRRYSHINGVGRHVLGHDGACTDYRTAADCNPFQNNCSRSNPTAGFYNDIKIVPPPARILS